MKIMIYALGFSLVGCGARPNKSITAASLASHAPTGRATLDSWAQGAQLLSGLGALHRSITTRSAESQRYFDQGLRLNYGFNHDEAARSFARSAQLDPDCASCFWGVALVLGPNYNVPMLPDRAAVAWDALQKAKALAPRASPTEQALVAALGHRYASAAPLDPSAMQPLTEAYARAMSDVARQFPAGLDVQVLYAESLMNVNPWKLWSLDGKPAAGTAEIVSTLESVIARDSSHPGANHYLIHALEASLHPERALASAERLAALMPAAGHIVHMPAHIFQRVGRYKDASAANRQAIEADKRYLAGTTPPGYYPMYIGHNYGFLAFSAAMEGRSVEALSAAVASAAAIPADMLSMMPGMEFFTSAPLFVMVRFSRWDEILKQPRPSGNYPILVALWLHAHGMALAAKSRFDDAAKDYSELVSLREKMPAEATAGNNPARDVALVAAKVLEAWLAQAQKRPDAVAKWADAVELEDKLAYNEPADWFYPIRHFQAAALLAMGQASQAEMVLREDLHRNPHNGWALRGLSEALRAQKKTANAARINQEFEEAWSGADIRPSSSTL